MLVSLQIWVLRLGWLNQADIVDIAASFPQDSMKKLKINLQKPHCELLSFRRFSTLSTNSMQSRTASSFLSASGWFPSRAFLVAGPLYLFPRTTSRMLQSSSSLIFPSLSLSYTGTGT
ncbi:Hypothetical_protein [Hexamita inflata]|uniref:Hypothetical_protein n=1 Tax=Hexamita inflata TaxID=28002 RepID=A0AA86PN96_9EUKA|nr:Hypothetical protein HINF_LOCUS30261 [Hexamita inflata]